MGSLWRVLENENVQHCLFQYASTGNSACEGCGKFIPKNALRAKVENGTKFYHFDCFWRYETTAKCKKDEIMIAVEKVNTALTGHGVSRHFKFFDKPKNVPYISLQKLDEFLTGFNPLIRPDDVKRIREQAALAQEGKTPYYLPSVVERQHHHCFYCEGAVDKNDGLEADKRYHTYGLRYDQTFYHPQCLAKSRIVNIDAKEILGYDTLDENDRVFYDETFDKDNDADPIFMVHTNLNLEHCASKECNYLKPLEDGKKRKKFRAPIYQRAIKQGDVRIRYENFSYHPECFAKMGKVNVDGREIRNYGILDESEQELLDIHFKKSKLYDTPLVEKVEKDGYCNAEKCCVSNKPSKFPYPYTVKEGQLQIRYKGATYHPTCFQASGKITIVSKDLRNYNKLAAEDKQILDGIFKKSLKRKSSDTQADVASNDDEGYSTKRKRLSIDDDEEEETEDGSYAQDNVITMEIVVNRSDDSGLNNSETFDESELNEGNGMDALLVPKIEVKEEYQESEFGQSYYTGA